MPDQYSKLVGYTLKYPYLVGISTDAGNLGTGILISARFVLTCGHVVHDSNSVEVISQKGSTSARIQKVDESLDLALLEVSQPIPAPNAKFSDFSLPSGGVLRTAGVQETPGHPDELSVAEIELKYRNKNDADGQVLDFQLEGGARPGYSGGPVIAEEGGALLCVGVMRLGGPGASSSYAIGPTPIRAFLAEYIPDISEDKSGASANATRRLLILTAILCGVFVVGAVARWFSVAPPSPKAASSAGIASAPKPEKTAGRQSVPGKDTPADRTKVSSPQASPESDGPKYIVPPQTFARPNRVDQENPDVTVWVNTASNVYHCPGSKLYGNTIHGKYMTQAEAQKTANRPSHGKVCR